MTNLNCPECNTGHIVMIDAPQGTTGYNYVCSAECGWICADPERTAAYRKQEKQQEKPKKKALPPEPQVDDPEITAFIRRECVEAEQRLRVERAKYPPTNIMKKGVLTPNPAFTDAMRKRLHTLAYSAEAIRQELITT